MNDGVGGRTKPNIHPKVSIAVREKNGGSILRNEWFAYFDGRLEALDFESCFAGGED
jgi:hypothetical protein